MKSINLALIFVSFFLMVSCEKDIAIVLDNQWVASSIKFENGDFETPGSLYYLIFENKGQFRLQLDVNLCGGEVSFKKKLVNFKNGIACTEACCDSEFAIALINNLTRTKYWAVNNRLLVFSNDNGLEIIFEKATKK